MLSKQYKLSRDLQSAPPKKTPPLQKTCGTNRKWLPVSSFWMQHPVYVCKTISGCFHRAFWGPWRPKAWIAGLLWSGSSLQRLPIKHCSATGASHHEPLWQMRLTMVLKGLGPAYLARSAEGYCPSQSPCQRLILWINNPWWLLLAASSLGVDDYVSCSSLLVLDFQGELKSYWVVRRQSRTAHFVDHLV